MDFDAGAEYALKVLESLLPVEPGDVININIPRLSQGRPKGVRVAPQSTNGFHEHYVPQPEGLQTTFRLASGLHRTEQTPTDTMLLWEGFITVTPLQPDMTCYPRLADLQQRLALTSLAGE